MRRRLLRGFVASVLAFAVALPGTAQPAHAGPDGAADTIIEAINAISRLIAGRGSPEDVQTLVRAAIAAITEARDEVIVHLDAQQAAAARAAAISASNEFSDFDRIMDDELGLEQWTFLVGRSATSAKEQLAVLSDRPAADQLGKALHQLYNLALVGAEYAGVENYRKIMTAEYIAANQAILEKLEPACRWHDPESMPGGFQRYYECKGANGVDTASRYEQYLWGKYVVGPVNTDEVKLEAAMNSSWAVAKEILPTLTP